MTVASIYLLLCVAGLPFWVAQQHLGGRSIPFVLMSCAYAAYAVISGAGIPMDNITLIVGCLAAWLCTSLIWSNTHKSAFELINWMSYLVLFCAARTVPMAFIALCVFFVCVMFAMVQMYSIGVKGQWHPEIAYYAFNNGNHTGAFMLGGLFAGLWLAFNLSLWLLPFVALVAAALITSKCKGAILAALAGTVGMTYASGHWWIGTGLSVVIFIVAFLVYCKWPHHVEKSFCGRIALYRAAVELIRQKPIAGWGLNSYAKELPETDTITLSATDENKRSHRVHNDHLEIIVEIGVIGYVLIVALFSSISYDPGTFGLLMAFAVCACFFFPLREVHTAAPFWAVMGASAGGTLIPVCLPPTVIILVCAIIIAVVLQTLKIFRGQWYSEMAKNKKGITHAEKLALYDIALENDPDNGGYLSDAAYLNFETDPVKAFHLMERAVVNYDGERRKHQIYDLYTRCLIKAGESRVCHWAEDRALRLEKEYDPAITVKNYLYLKERKAH